jgi:hypothetical protein
VRRRAGTERKQEQDAHDLRGSVQPNAHTPLPLSNSA